MLHIPALWYFDTLVMYSQWFPRVKFVVIPPCFAQQQYLWNIAIQQAVGCYNSWANLRCSSCSPLGWKWDYHNIAIVIHKQIYLKISSAKCQPFCQGIFSSPVDKMAAVSKTIFSVAFSWMKRFVFWLKFHWSLFLRVQITIFHHWFR